MERKERFKATLQEEDGQCFFMLPPEIYEQLEKGKTYDFEVYGNQGTIIPFEVYVEE